MTPDSESNAPVPDEDDDGLEWLRAIRREIAAEAGNDIFEMGRRLRERERASGRQFYRTERVLVPVEGVPADVDAPPEDAGLSGVLREEPPAR